MEETKKGKDYDTLFDPEVYLGTYYNDVMGHEAEGDLLPFAMNTFHAVFSPGLISGKRLLDIGTGPTVHNIISASKHFEDIFLSDFSQPNRETLEKWRNGSLTHSFIPFFQFVADKENKGEVPEEMEESLRGKVKEILFCDLLQQEYLTFEPFVPFDTITSSLCLEAVAPDLATYETIVSKIKTLLKPGGHLILFGVLGEKFYKVGNYNFFCLDLKKNDLQIIWKKYGFDIQIWKETAWSESKDNTMSDFEGAFLMVARKAK